ncbi:pseudouridine-5'-phosphate glycosidase [Fodinicurvata sp. EGI_FJ10296]|uniref:pseudouridine-5'-phosphate glycosidase n=1 Tax=Fodinicurvata sp. EGI_FJ10296 TaxID=3231908 RepID=UPI003451455A
MQTRFRKSDTRADPALDLVDMTPEVAEAIAIGGPVVALESTIIAHGMPYPDNLATGRMLEQTVRDSGGVPATVAVLDGRLKLGLTPDMLERIATDPAIAKASRRDLPILMARGGSGATTVAATMIVAGLASVRVFATGAIGGVHRGAEASFDISADLQELASTPVAVVCAGAKSILDLPKTLEYLETHGVPVLGYGTDVFPAFYCTDSGLGCDARCDTPDEIAAILAHQDHLGYRQGTVIANPIPAADAIDPATVDAAINNALAEAELKGIKGKETTPFLLSRVVDATGGASLKANIALARNNAALAGRIATAYAAP